MLNKIKKRHWLKQRMAFLLAILMIFNQNILVRAEGNSGDTDTESVKYLYSESFDGTELPTGISGTGTVDVENEVLNVDVIGDTDISITPVDGITEYTIEYDMMRLDTYDENTDNYVQFKMYDTEGVEICTFDTRKSNLRIKYYQDSAPKYRKLLNGSVEYAIVANTWANYKYVINFVTKTISLTVTDSEGNIFIDNDTTQSAFYGNCSDLGKIQFKIPAKNGEGTSNEADYSVDNLEVYYIEATDTENGGNDPAQDNDIPSDAVVVYNENFDGNTVPEGFHGAWVLDDTNQVLNYSTSGSAAKVVIPSTSDVNIYTVEFDMKRTDELPNAFIQTRFQHGSVLNDYFAMSDTSGQQVRVREVIDGNTRYQILTGYTVETNVWTSYKYELDMVNQQVTITVTDASGNSYNHTTGYFAEFDTMSELWFYIPSGGEGASYAIDNFVAYYTTVADDVTEVFRETFSDASLPTGFTGAFVLDTENQQANIFGSTSSGTTAKVTFGRINNVEKYTVEFDMKRTDEDSSAYMQMKYYDSVGTEISLSDTRNQTFRLRDKAEGTVYGVVENYAVNTGVWAHYKYVLDIETQQITATVTDDEGTVYTSIQAMFDAICENVYELQFYIPTAGGTAKYSIDNFVAYYTGGSSGDDAEVSENYVTNAGFEVLNTNPGDGYTGNGAQAWNKYGNWGTSNIREVDSEIVHSGEYSMKLGGQALTDQVSIRQTINGLNPDKYYKLSGYIKAENYYPATPSKPIGPALRVDAANTASAMYWIAKLPVTTSAENTYDWTYTEIVFTPGTDQVYLQCRMEYGSGQVWYDDLSLVEYEPYVSLALSKNLLTLSGGEEEQLNATPYPIKEENVIKWESSNPEVATVDENGKVIASSTKSGEAIITATVTEQICTKSSTVSNVDVTDYCKVIVQTDTVPEPIREVKVNKKAINLVVGEGDSTIDLITIPAAAKETTEFVWTTSDSSVAVVTDGYIVPIGEGIATITASVKGNKTIADYCEVTVTQKEIIPLELSQFVNQENSEFDEKIHSSGYPKLLFSYEDIAGIRQKAKTSYTAYTFTKMEEYADAMLESDMVIHPNEAAGGRKLQSYLTNLAMTGYIKQDMRYINRAIDIMISSAEEYTVDEYYAMNGNLSIGDAAQAYAIGYDWLYPFMTSEEKQTVVELLDGLGTYVYGLSSYYYTYPATATNHSSVMYGGLGLIGLIRDNTDWISRATEVITAYYQNSSDTTGFYNEGTDYMMYGALGAVTYSAAYQRATNVDLIEQYSYMEENMDMLLYYFLPDRDSVLPIGDSYGTLCPMGSWMYLISKYQDEVSLWQYLEMTGEEGTQLYGLAESDDKGASAAYILIWADTSLEAKTPSEAGTLLTKEFESGYNVYRDGWDGNMDTLISFVSGSTTHRGHNQRDENSFAFYAKGEDFAIDPGYSPSETVSHNALLVDGVGQAVPGDQYDVYGAIIKSEKLAENIYYVEGEATDTYPDRVNVSSYIRRMLVCTGDVPYIIVIDDIDKANDVKSNYSWLLQTSKTNKLLVQGNSAQIIGSKKGSVLNVEFPFEESVIFRTNPWTGLTIGGAQGDYAPFAYSQTLETIVSGADKRIISILTARDYNELIPIVETTGTSDNGTIKISYYNGKADLITINAGNVGYQQLDIELIDVPEMQEPLTKEELDALGVKDITMQISGIIQDFENIIVEDTQIVVDVEEFITVFRHYTAIDDDMETLLRTNAISGDIAFSTACDVIEANYIFDEELRHITVTVKEDIYKVTGSDISISSVLDNKITLQGIDARTDQNEYPPQNAIDGDLSTYFTIQGDTGEPVILELGAEYEVYAVGVAFTQGSKRTSRFDVQVSMDKENWETVRCAISSGTTELLEGYSVFTSNARYIRFLGYGNSINTWNSIREIEIYGTEIDNSTSQDNANENDSNV